MTQWGFRYPLLLHGSDEPMTPEVLVGVLSLAGTLIGSLAGILAANRLTNYRIEQLEKKVDAHNTLIDRMYKVEEKTELHQAELVRINRRLTGLEDDAR